MSVIDITFPGNVSQVATAAALRAIPSAFIKSDALYFVPALRSMFSWDGSSFADDDGATILRPNDITPLQAGRWLISLVSNVTFPLVTNFAGPTMNGGLLGANDGLSLSNQIDNYNLSGTRTKAQIGRSIQISDNQTGPPSSAGANTAGSASYGLAISGIRPNWNTSTITGEMDGISVFLRQARGDAAGMLSNIGIQSGFAATLESITFAADSAGVPIKAVRVQVGSANPRDGGYFGFTAIAETGTNLSAGLYVAASAGASWARYIDIYDKFGGEAFYINGSDGSVVTKSIIPLTPFGGDIGLPAQRYNGFYGTVLSLIPIPFASLIASYPAASHAGYMARINDAASAITTFNQVVSAGGGVNGATVISNGTNYVAISS